MIFCAKTFLFSTDQPGPADDDATEFHRAAAARRRCDPWSEAAAALLALDTHAPEAHAGLGVVRAVDAEQLQQVRS